MEDDEFDSRSPIGEIIKHINDICKKTQIDDQLSEVIIFRPKFRSLP